MTFAKALDDYGKQAGVAVSVRTDYRCKAHGCPNAGSMEGDLCYAHWKESDPANWARVTTEIRANFETMRNWGEQRAPEKTRIENNKNADPKAWAYAFKEREERGDNLTPAQREMWRNAI